MWNSVFMGSSTANKFNAIRAETVVATMCPGYSAYYYVETYHQATYPDGVVGAGWTWTNNTVNC